MLRTRTALTGLVATAALVAGSLGAGLVGAAAADEPRSTPVPLATPEGQLSAYVVNSAGTGAATQAATERAIAGAGGDVVQAWPQIGVYVVHSTSADFRRDVARSNAVHSVGATRSVAVSEGTPGTAGAAQPSSAPLKREFRNTATADLRKDPQENKQWDMRVIKADRAHETSDGSRDVLVGVLDSGIDPDHPDLRSNIDTADSVNCSDAGKVDTSPTGWFPTTSDHGTHVAGTIAAARNGKGIVGVAPNARLASVKVVNDDGFIYPEYAVCGFMWAGLHGMDVTNNSYFVDPFMYYCDDQPDQAAAKEAVARAVAWSTDQGTVHAAAAGNAATDLSNNTTDTTSPDDGTPVRRTINSGCHDIPTELPGVVTVSSFAQVGNTTGIELSGFSNRGLGVIDVGAPGSHILSTVVKNNGYGYKSGTSMASPHAAGVLALLAGAHPGWTPAQLGAAIEAQADDQPCAPPQGGRGALCVGTDEENSYAGEGIVDALEALAP